MSFVEKCPVCEGRGWMYKWYYNPKIRKEEEEEIETCRACKGKGVFVNDCWTYSLPNTYIWPQESPSSEELNTKIICEKNKGESIMSPQIKDNTNIVCPSCGQMCHPNKKVW